jgi:hypothetical protein
MKQNSPYSTSFNQFHHLSTGPLACTEQRRTTAQNKSNLQIHFAETWLSFHFNSTRRYADTGISSPEAFKPLNFSGPHFVGFRNPSRFPGPYDMHGAGMKHGEAVCIEINAFKANATFISRNLSISLFSLFHQHEMKHVTYLTEVKLAEFLVIMYKYSVTVVLMK